MSWATEQLQGPIPRDHHNTASIMNGLKGSS